MTKEQRRALTAAKKLKRRWKTLSKKKSAAAARSEELIEQRTAAVENAIRAANKRFTKRIEQQNNIHTLSEAEMRCVNKEAFAVLHAAGLPITYWTTI
jgi:ABC-type transport system involved in cytochrome bd biosynthesis fused ATPase/permease subunit